MNIPSFKIAYNSTAAVIFLMFCWICPAPVNSASGDAISVSGMVVRPLALSAHDLEAFGQSLFRGGSAVERPYRGVTLRSVLEFCRIANTDGTAADPDRVFVVVKNASGGRAVFAWKELRDGAPDAAVVAISGVSSGDGRPGLVAPGNVVPAITSIEVTADPRACEGGAKLYIIGVGCGDASLITQEAISYMARSDAFVCTKDIGERFAPYMAGRPMLFDPLMNLPHYYRKTHPGTSAEEAKRAVEKLRADNIELIKKTLSGGKSVGFLDYGDPTIYGSWTYWLMQHFAREQYHVVPGVSAFNAANAMIAKNVAVNGSAVITVPDGMRNNEDLVRAVAAKGDTLAIFVGLAELEALMPLVRKHFRDDTPVVVVYRAGYALQGKMVRATVSSVLGAVASEKEKFLGIIYIGEALR